MRFKRKIAAALAAVMAFGGALGFAQLEARQNLPSTQVIGAGVTGHFDGMRFVDVDTGMAQTNNLRTGADLIIPAAQLSFGVGTGSITFTLGGYAAWNYRPVVAAPAVRPAGSHVAAHWLDNNGDPTVAPSNPAAALTPGNPLHVGNPTSPYYEWTFVPAHWTNGWGFFIPNVDNSFNASVTGSLNIGYAQHELVEGGGYVPPTRTIRYTGRNHPQAHIPNEIPFTLEFLPFGQVVVRYDQTDVIVGTTVLRIPLAFNFTGGGEARLNIVEGTTLPAGDARTFLLTGAGRGVNVTLHGGITTGRMEALVNRIEVREVGTTGFNLGAGRAITLTLPHNYRFATADTLGFTAVNVTGFGNVPVVAHLGTTVEAIPAAPTGHAGAYAFTSVHPGTQQSRLHIVLGSGFSPVAPATAPEFGRINANQSIQLHLTSGIQVTHRDRNNPVWANDIEVVVSNGFGGGFLRANGTLHSAAADGGAGDFGAVHGTIAGGTLPVATLQDWGLTFSRVSGDAGNIQTVDSGRTFNLGTPGAGPAVPAHFRGAVARVQIEENVPQSAWGARDFTFTLTDAEGNVLPHAKIAGVQFNSWAINPGGGTVRMPNGGFSDNVTFRNVVPALGGTGNTNGTIIANANQMVGNVGVNFSPDGSSVSVINMQPTNQNTQRVRLQATIYVSVDVNWEGPIYVSVSDRAQGHWDVAGYINETILQVATARKLLDIETAVTNLNVGFQSVPVQNVTLNERAAGVLMPGRAIQLALTEFGVVSARTDVGFNNITQAQVNITGHANPQNRALVNVIPQHGQPQVNLGVARASNQAGSSIDITGLTVYVQRGVPYGTYGVVVRGDAILDNDNLVINSGVQPGQAGFRRYGFTGLIFQPFINVVTPGTGAGMPTNNVRVPHTAGNFFYVNDVRMSFLNANDAVVYSVNQDPGRLFVPVRAVTEALGAVIEPIFNDDLTVRSVVVTLGGKTVEWFIGSTTFTVDGVSRSMMTGGIPVRPFIATTGANAGTTFLPVRYIANAFGLELADNVGGFAVINPTAEQMAANQTGTTAVQPTAENGNGYENGNGNGNGYDDENGDD
ncbi:MAG: copper amine oxidase N-terminal domain-containing protein [Defluviitaleaceae bacterium]|nr:copper amine oxidase N-terminal domain-containing protein [Defluviitaleaceae bacterium]